MMSPLRLLQVVEIATCLLGFSLKCGADGNVVPASLSRCVHQKFLRFSLNAVLVCKALRPADFDDRPFVSQNSHMCNAFPSEFFML